MSWKITRIISLLLIVVFSSGILPYHSVFGAEDTEKINNIINNGVEQVQSAINSKEIIPSDETILKHIKNTPQKNKETGLIVKFKIDKQNAGSIDAKFKNLKIKNYTKLNESGLYYTKADNKAVNSLIENFKNNKNVEYVEQDFQVRKKDDQITWNIDKVKALEVHNENYYGEGINVAVFDTGIDTDNIDLNVIGGISFVEGMQSYDDDNGHGTGIAAIIASLDNNYKLVGVSPKINLYSVKVLDSYGNGTYSNIINGIQWAINNNINIISMSLGGMEYSKALEDAINDAYDHNILIIAAAGNEGTENAIDYPARFNRVISVGAVDKDNILASFSNKGEELDIVAPGVGVETIGLDGSSIQVKGTSASVAHASGVASLIWCANRELSNNQVNWVICKSVTVLGAKNEYGYGLVNAASSLELLKSDLSIPDIYVDPENHEGEDDVGEEGKIYASYKVSGDSQYAYPGESVSVTAGFYSAHTNCYVKVYDENTPETIITSEYTGAIAANTNKSFIWNISSGASPGIYKIHYHCIDNPDATFDDIFTIYVVAKDSYESNDSFYSATTISGSSPIYRSGTISKPGDCDYYKIYLNAGDLIKIEFTNYTINDDSIFALYGPSYEYLNSTIFVWEGFTHQCMQSGYYYIKVDDYQYNYYSINNYTLEVTVTSIPNDAYEGNNNYVFPYSLSSYNTNLNATINSPTDVDWYRFYLPYSGTIRVDLTNMQYVGKDYDLFLYGDSDMSSYLACSVSGTGLNESITYSIGSAGYYYIYIKGCNYYDYSAILYNLQIAFSPNILFTVEPEAVSTVGNSATITWETNFDSNSVVNYGTTTSLDLTASVSTLTKNHSVTIGGLSPSTKYYYRVSSSVNDVTKSSDIKDFGTADQYEPNDVYTSATLVDFSTDYFATINNSVDVDFYKINVPSNGTVTISLQNIPTGNDYDLLLFVGDDPPKSANHLNTAESITTDLGAGIYSFAVYPYPDMYGSNYDAYNKYRIQVTFQAQFNPPYIIEELHYGGNGAYSPTGNFSKTYSDIKLESSGFDIDISRTYNSKDAKCGGPFGRGWTLSYEGNCNNLERICRMSDGSIWTFVDTSIKVVELPDGSIQRFEVSGSAYTALDSRNKLENQFDGTKVLTTPDQIKYIYNGNGYLGWIKDKYNNTITIQVDSTGKVLGITDQVGRHFTITYNNQGQIQTITDDIGNRIVTYSYTNNLLSTVNDTLGNSIVSYAYYPTGDLRQDILKEVRDNGNNIVNTINYYTQGEYTGNVLTEEDINSNIYSYTYDLPNHKTTITDTNNLKTIQSYDDKKFILASIDPGQKSTIIQYFTDSEGKNVFGEAQFVTDRNGNRTEYIRDSRGNVTKVINPDGSEKNYGYDSMNNLIFEKDEEGKSIFYVYDSAMKNLLKKVQPLDGISSYIEGVSNDENYAITRYTYYDDGENGYTAKSLLESITDPEGLTTTYTYDSYGNVQTEKDSETNISALYHYNSDSLLEYSISKKGIRTDYVYDKNGKLERMQLTGSRGETTRIVYDAMGRKVQEISPKQYNQSDDGLNYQNTVHTYNNSSVGYRYNYYPNGKLHTIIDPLGYVTTYEAYDEYGNVKREKKPNGSIYEYNYDEMNRLLNLYFRDNESASPILLEEYSYTILPDKRTQKTFTKYLTDNKKIETKYIYNYTGRQVSQINNDNTSILTSYYYNGLVKTQTDPKQQTTEFFYDGLNRLKIKKVPFEKINGVTFYSETINDYDKNDNIIHEMITSNRPGEPISYDETSYEYNKRNLLTKIIKYNSGNPANYTQYYYDAEGNKLRMYTGLSSPLLINGLDNVTHTGDSDYSTIKYEYNALNKISKMIDNMGHDEEYTYDLNGNLEKKIDRNENTTTMAYDDVNRLINKNVTCLNSLQDVSYAYEYGASGNIEATSGGGINISYNYFPQGWLKTETNSNGVIKKYEYDRAGNRISFILEKAGVTEINESYTYNNMSRLENVYENNQLMTTYTYDLNGNRDKVINSNNTNTTYVYNLSNKLTLLTNMKGSTKLSEYSYAYYLNGNQASKTDTLSNETRNYIYDGLGRLKSEFEIGKPTIIYTYDDYSNRKRLEVSGESVTDYDYDLNFRLITESKVTGDITETTRYGYDYNGNQIYKAKEIIKPLIQGENESFIASVSGKSPENEIVTINGYNGLNQLIETTIGDKAINYSYDVNGLRIKKDVNNVTTDIIWDGNEIVLELNGNIINNKYIRGLNLLYSKNTSNAISNWYLYNGHGDVVQLIGADENVNKSYNYDSFGNEINPDPNDNNAFRYCGEYFDKETGTIYLRARYYASGTGRFLSEDSYTGEDNDPLSLNLYTYCLNNPIIFTDPSGYMPKDSLNELNVLYRMTGPNDTFAGSLACFLANKLSFSGVFVAFHEIAQINVSKALTILGYVTELEYKIDGERKEIDIVGYKSGTTYAWEVKPKGGGGQTQLKEYLNLTKFEAGPYFDDIRNIVIIPQIGAFGGIFMGINYKPEGLAHYYFYRKNKQRQEEVVSSVSVAIMAAIMMKSLEEASEAYAKGILALGAIAILDGIPGNEVQFFDKFAPLFEKLAPVH